MSTIVWAVVIAAVMVAALLIPYLFQEIEEGKKQKKPNTPVGAGDVQPGTRSNPAPGQPDGQPDPYGVRVRR